ncbi:PEP-CTERM sorting domain-containing protein [Pacificimonas sp. WHA3]|uniref:PEP-CTERM sorting domain-containing protein n=1 Tax=Pacificimonas pallii TaxID=2827236 RepID=A0ABS6SCU5_9SPHN|nr:PEP-CTERM sorting domain-containing protein [Pacificimonas pallii]MBV7256204.1 PEP-CTERM sorting domain-containing protein [Pacificimonas pallii]
MKCSFLITAAVTATLATAASAFPVFWTDWQRSSGTNAQSNTAFGEINTGTDTIGVNYSGAISFFQDGVNGNTTNYWTEPNAGDRPYTGGPIDNAPPGAEMIALNVAGTKTLTFSQAVTDVYFGLVSWNGNSGSFSEQIDLVSEGTGYWGGGNWTLNGSGNGFVASGELHGVLRITGNFTSVSFTDVANEFWHGFTVGVAGVADPDPVPAPGALGLLGLGALALGLRRRSAR